jgi:pimeloyl-ACP methyl ester carboxylesterase
MAQTLSYAEKGKGEPVVLLHGFPLDRRMWEAQIAEFSARRRVIAPDLPGFGQSKSEEPFTIASLADDVHQFLSDINAVPCILAGLSMGGYVALAYMRKYASGVRGLILVDTKAEGDNPQQKEGRAKMVELARKEGSKAIADQMLPKLVAEDVPKTRPAIARSLRAMMEACPPRTIEHALVAMRDRPDQTPHLESIAAPTLIVVGDADAITPVTVAEAMQRRIPNSTMAVIRGAGHMSPVEQPAQVNHAMGQFLDATKR